MVRIKIKKCFWIFLGVCFLTAYCQAVTINWDAGGGADQSWATAANWVGDVVPTKVDLAIVGQGTAPIPAPFPVKAVISSSTQVHDLYVTRYVTPTGTATVDMTGGTLDVVEILRLNESGAAGNTSKAIFNMNNGTINIGYAIAGGTPDPTAFSSLQVSLKGDAVFNMNGGTVNVAQKVNIHHVAANNGTGTLNLFGGTIDANDLVMTTTGKSKMDITYGKMILNGDKTATVNPWVTAGYITAFGGTQSVSVIYDAGQNKTFITPEPATVILLGLGLLALKRRRAV